INNAKTAFANFLKQFVASDEVANALLTRCKGPLSFHGFAQKPSHTTFQKGVRLIVGEQGFNSFLEVRIACRRAFHKSRSSLDRLFQGLQKYFAFRSHFTDSSIDLP